MTSFGWKRKIGGSVSRTSSSAFEADAKDEEDEAVTSGEVDWLTLAPRRKIVCLEDAVAKSRRLQQEGTTLAESERYWEALNKWDEALLFTPDDKRLYEMKAQAYMELCEVYPAVAAASKATQLAPNWWIAYQTLGRAHLGLGEVSLAIKCFCKAVHLKPDDEELWKEDLNWTLELLNKKKNIQSELEQEEHNKTCQIVELDEEGHVISDPVNLDSNSTSVSDMQQTSLVSYSNPSVKKTLKKALRDVPDKYVMMRDKVT